MRVLLLHPEDVYADRLKRAEHWDVVFDLGTLLRLSGDERSSCEHSAHPISRAKFSDLSTIGEAFARGHGQMLDWAGFDWWDLLSIEFYEPLLELHRLGRFVRAFSPRDQFWVSREGIQARVLRQLCQGRVRTLPHRFFHRIRDNAARGLRLQPTQIMQICGDKYDASYRLRRLASRRAQRFSTPAVLLPSAYSNASRTALAYARALPDLRFILISTRQSGRVNDLPKNVSCAPLAAYAHGVRDSAELRHLCGTWADVQRVFEGDRDLSLLLRAGCFTSVPASLSKGLAIRDAWLQVLASHSVAGVLCADEMNWHTRLPLLIAGSRKIPTVACHHGAFDLRYSFRSTAADRFLAKGPMEWDYLVESCGMDQEKIEIGGPPQSHEILPHSERRHIVFFSEPYEAFGGRCSGYYREILPSLASLARQKGCKLVLKLHPFESRRERARSAARVLDADLRGALQIVDGPLDNELLQHAWFAVTITSSAAVDCAVAGIPAFLCRWLDFSDNGYTEQFIRFGVAKGLTAQIELERIPDMLKSFVCCPVQNLLRSADPERLRSLLTGRVPERHILNQLPRKERAWA